MSRALSLAGFQVTLIGRIWVTPEDLGEMACKVMDWRQAIRAVTFHILGYSII